MNNIETSVFLVDDDPVILKVLPRALRRRGFQVQAFSSATDFLHVYSGAPGCLVLDLSMPNMTGLELQQELIHRKFSIPIIFITGHGGIRQSVKALKLGAIDFLEKPFKPEVLLKRIKEAFVVEQENRARLHKTDEIQSRFARLTPREAEVFRLLIANEEHTSSKLIARELGISHRTVDQHRARILQKTKTKSIAELLLLARKSGVELEQ